MTTVIIDGDILMYKIPEDVINEMVVKCDETDDMIYREIAWGSKTGIAHFLDKKIQQIKEQTKADTQVICLSSPTNFRKDLNPNYKANRKQLKPFIYEFVRDYLEDIYGAYIRDNLEADDLIGIIATYKGKLRYIPEGEKVIWSMDKDFKTIPSVFYKEKADGTLEKYVISEQEADYNMLFQTLTGDSTDGYSGCPGIGKVKAQSILGNPETFDLKSGWKTVIETFKKQGLSKDDALLQARCARILRSCDYDLKTKEIKLWSINKENYASR